MKKRTSLLLFVLLLTMGLPSAHAQTMLLDYRIFNGNILYVGGSGPNNYTQIQDAINNATNGDTIFVYCKTYNPIVVDKTLSFFGINDSQNVRPQIFGGTSSDCVTVNAEGCLFNNFKIRNGPGGYGNKGFVINLDHTTITHCLICETGWGIGFYSSNNSIDSNELSEGWSGIVFQSSCYNSSFTNNYLHGFDEHTIKGAQIKCTWVNNNVQGDFYFGGSQCTLIGNTIGGGFTIGDSLSMVVINNTFLANGITIYGSRIDQTTSHTIRGNTLNNKPIYYYHDLDGYTVPPDASQVILANCSNFTIKNLNINKTSIGISLLFSSYNLIANNSISSSPYLYGISLFNSSNNSIIGNHLINHQVGIYILQSNYNLVGTNELTSCDHGIEIKASRDNRLSENSLLSCRFGIFVDEGSYQTIIEHNSVERSSWAGITLYEDKNKVLRNNVSDCDVGILIYSSSDDEIDGNFVFNNGYGIHCCEYPANILIKNNLIQGNQIGLCLDCSKNVKVTANNFISNVKSAQFIVDNLLNDKGRWRANYWSDKKGFAPYVIHGETLVFGFKCFAIDWFAKLKPYPTLF